MVRFLRQWLADAVYVALAIAMYGFVVIAGFIICRTPSVTEQLDLPDPDIVYPISTWLLPLGIAAFAAGTVAASIGVIMSRQLSVFATARQELRGVYLLFASLIVASITIGIATWNSGGSGRWLFIGAPFVVGVILWRSRH